MEAIVMITRLRQGQYNVIGHHFGCDGEVAVLLLKGEGRGHFERLCSVVLLQEALREKKAESRRAEERRCGEERKRKKCMR